MGLSGGNGFLWVFFRESKYNGFHWRPSLFIILHELLKLAICHPRKQILHLM